MSRRSTLRARPYDRACGPRGWSPARAEDPDPSDLCDAAIAKAARRGGVPVEVLHAVALTETGQHRDGRMRAWPWAINREGKGYWFKTHDEALAFGKQSLAAGRTSFDVGCVQINYRWHGHAFPSIEEMFDPEWTATYAAQFLRTLYEERGSWSEAAGAYHSLTPDKPMTYRARFDRLLAGSSPEASPTPRSSSPPPQPRSASRTPPGPPRGAAPRHGREASAPPARRRPPPAAGSPASSSSPPPARSSAPGTPLLTQGQPLLAAPGSLF